MGFRAYDKDGNLIKRTVVVDCQKAVKAGEIVRTEQSHKSEVDINNIVKKHGADLVGKIAALQNWQYDDVTGNDFQESMNAIIKAKETFESVPSDIRKQFGNDPARFMDFVHNPDNQDKLVEMGLANAKNEPEPIQVIVTNPVETPPPTTSEPAAT